MVTVGPISTGRADVPRYFFASDAAVIIERHERTSRIAAEDRLQTVDRFDDGRQRPHVAPVVAQAERDGRPSGRQLMQERGDPSELRAPTLEELSANRREGEEIAHRHTRARRRRSWRGCRRRDAGCFDARAHLVAMSPRYDFQPARCGDAGKTFTAEAKRANGEEIIGDAQFAGRVPLQGDRQILRPYAAAVIRDRDRYAPAFHKLDAHRGGARVQTVLDELLDDRDRSLYDLAGGYLRDGRIIEHSDPVYCLHRVAIWPGAAQNPLLRDNLPLDGETLMLLYYYHSTTAH